LKSDLVYLQHMLQACNRIVEYTQGDPRDFFNDTKAQDAVLRNFQILGDAARLMSEEGRRKFNTIPWQEILGMRNTLVHAYFGVDLEIVLKTVQKDVPKLQQSLSAIIGT